jgi:polysaccharide lyase-like protein
MGAWNIFTQFHNTGTTGQANVHFAIVDRKTVGLRVDGGNVRNPREKSFALARFAPGRWYDFVFHVKWSSNPKVGFVEVWVNRAKVLKKKTLATLYAGQGVYLKQGFYRAAYGGTTVVYHDGMRRGSSYTEVTGRGPTVRAPQ